jgi:hypothetical protein
MTKPFLIRHADGREYELAGDKAGKDAYRDDYQSQGFKLVDPQPHTHERPDLSEPKKAKKDDESPERGRTAVSADGAGRVSGPDVHAADADGG